MISSKQRQARQRPGATRAAYPVYFTKSQHAAIARVAGKVSFSSYVASAALREAQADGAVFYGAVRGGGCDRADPERGAGACATGEPASWWNRFTRAWCCPPCGAKVNAVEPGICLAPEELRKLEGLADECAQDESDPQDGEE